MIVAITSVKKITAKKTGINYTIVSGVTKTGNSLKAFLTDEQLGSIPVVAPSPATLEKAFQVLPTLDVNFDDAGQVDSVSESK